MRKILFAWALLSLPVMMLAQKPGTLDQDFANGGHYSFAVTGSQAWLNFMTYRYESNASEPGWALLLGGNIYKNYVYDGIFTTEITQDGELNQWAGKPATDLTDIQDAIYLPGGGFMAVGSADIGGNHNAKVSQFNGPGEVNSNFGVSGSITLDNQTGADYAHDICYNNSDPDNPFYMVVGSTMNAGNMQKTAWWMLGPDGQLNNDFGANGMYVPATGGETAWLNDVVSFGNKVVAAGTIDYLAYIKILDPNTMISGSLLFPSSSDPDHIYEYFSVIPEGDHFFASGYHYDMGSYKSNEFVRGVDSEPFAFNDGISDILNTGVSNVESQVNGFSTGIHSVFPAQAGPGGMKTDGPSPMVIIGSIIIGSEEETSFVAAINADGSLADDFGTNGVYVIDLEEGNWPVDVVLSEDGSLFVGVNAVGVAHVYKLYAYFDRSGIEDPNQNINKVTIYPNPVSHTAHLELSLSQAQELEWSIYNSIGQAVLSQTESVTVSGVYQIDIDISGWASGVYHFKAFARNGELSSKFSIH